MLQTLYAKAESAVLNGGTTTRYYELGRSARQGCPASCVLFILVLEPLLVQLRHAQGFRGIQIRGTDMSVSCFADDMTVLLGSEEDLTYLLNSLDEYKIISGLAINRAKSELMPLDNFPGAMEDTGAHGLKMVTSVKITGIHVGPDMRELEHANFDTPIANMEAKFAAWKDRQLSFLGRILVAKAHGQAMVQYQLGAIELPQWAATKINKIIYKFIWRSRDYIPRDMLGKEFREGGARFYDIRKVAAAAAFQWATRFAMFRGRAWETFLQADVDRLGGNEVLQGKMILSKLAKKNMHYSFNRVVFEAWGNLSGLPELPPPPPLAPPTHPEALANASPWWNPKVTDANGQTLAMRGLIRLGYHKIGMFYNNDELGHIVSTAQALEMGLSPALALEWMGITRAIPRSIRGVLDGAGVGMTDRSTSINQHQPPQDETRKDIKIRILQGDHMVKGITQAKYLQLLYANPEAKTSSRKCALTERYEVTEEEWEELYKRTRYLTTNVKIRSFQYRRAIGFLYANRDFHEFGFRPDDMCSFCMEPDQTVNHLFYDCIFVQVFIADVQHGFQVFKDNPLTDRKLFTGVERSSPDAAAVNWLMVLINEYIYSKYQERVERALAKTPARLERHAKKYEKFTNQFGILTDCEVF